MDEDKINKAIEALKTAEKIARDFYDKPVVVTYSGGKDSDVLLDLAIKSGISFEVSHSITTVDAPQTNRHVNKVFEKLHEQGINAYKRSPMYKGEPINMFELIARKGIPPTRLVRYCCGVFKEGTEKKQSGCTRRESCRVKKATKQGYIFNKCRQACKFKAFQFVARSRGF